MWGNDGYFAYTFVGLAYYSSYKSVFEWNIIWLHLIRKGESPAKLNVRDWNEVRERLIDGILRDRPLSVSVGDAFSQQAD